MYTWLGRDYSFRITIDTGVNIWNPDSPGQYIGPLKVIDSFKAHSHQARLRPSSDETRLVWMGLYCCRMKILLQCDLELWLSNRKNNQDSAVNVP